MDEAQHPSERAARGIQRTRYNGRHSYHHAIRRARSEAKKHGREDPESQPERPGGIPGHWRQNHGLQQNGNHSDIGDLGRDLQQRRACKSQDRRHIHGIFIREGI